MIEMTRRQYDEVKAVLATNAAALDLFEACARPVLGRFISHTPLVKTHIVSTAVMHEVKMQLTVDELHAVNAVLFQ